MTEDLSIFIITYNRSDVSAGPILRITDLPDEYWLKPLVIRVTFRHYLSGKLVKYVHQAIDSTFLYSKEM